jgi:hypothetical protein
MATFRERIARTWSAFKDNGNFDYTKYLVPSEPSQSSYSRSVPNHYVNDRSLVTAILNRIAVDAASVDMMHATVNANGFYKSTVNDGLNRCLTLAANIDQSGRAFRQDIIMSMLEEGGIVVSPTVVETDADELNPEATINVEEMRVGKIEQFYTNYVRARIYNDNTGKQESTSLKKTDVAIIQNPFYEVMNMPNSTVRRLSETLAILDIIDSRFKSNKLDIIIQVPYTIQSQHQKALAKERQASIDDQLQNSPYGIAYIDGSEKVIQLNRPLENNLMAKVEYLTNLLFSQLGINKAVFEGTATEEQMILYHSRTIEPILAAIADEFTRKFIGTNSYTRGHRVMYIRNPFKLIPASQMADISDKYTRNEIMSTNEVRSLSGLVPVDDPRADELRNKNLNASDSQVENPIYTTNDDEEYENTDYAYDE